MLFLVTLLALSRGQTAGSACDYYSECGDTLYCKYAASSGDPSYELSGQCTTCPTDPTTCADENDVTADNTFYQAYYECTVKCEGQPETDDHGEDGACHDLDLFTYDNRGGFDNCWEYDSTHTSYEINECGAFDDTDFKADDLCCACGGGTAKYGTETCISSDSLPNYDMYCGSSYTDLCIDDTGDWHCVNQDNFWVHIDCKTCEGDGMKGGAIALVVFLVLCCFCGCIVAPIACCCGATAICCQAGKSSNQAGTVNDTANSGL